MKKPKKPSAKDSVLVLRVNPPDMVAARDHVTGGFLWPNSGYVEAPDWSNRKACGNGLHGWLWGVGDIGAAGANVDDADAKWLVVRVRSEDVVDLDGKVKFPRGWVEFCGKREDAVAVISRAAPKNTPVMFGTATAGDAGTATAGYAGTATAGDAGTAIAGSRGTAIAGSRGTATAGDRGTATAGDAGTAIAGSRGTATAGDAGTAIAGYRGTATAGDAGVVGFLWFDHAAQKYRRAIGLIDGEKLKPGVKYCCNDKGEIVEKK
jgi:hypothetical protein